LNIDSFDII